jgi:hypothetical protein
MSEIHVQHIKSRLEKDFLDIIDLSDVKADSKDKENFFLTRALAAYAIQNHSECSIAISADSITDGSGDNGIDAIYYDTSSNVFYLVQSKWIHKGNGEPDNGDIKKFIAGIKDLVNFRFDRFNQKVQKKEAIIKSAICDSKTKYQIIIVYTGINDLAEPSRRDFSDLLTEYNDAGEVVFLSVFNQKRIHTSLVISVDEKQPIDQIVQLKQFGKVSEPYTGYYGQVNGAEIYGWWDKYKKRLFTKNIRGGLGETEVNGEIVTTLEQSPELFWFFNNGVTLICDSVIKNMVGGGSNELGHFDCKNISIVNGAQTVSTIGKFGEEDHTRLNNVFVPVRIIELLNADERFGHRITKANNTQNKVENRDFVMFDPEQTRIREELLIDNIEYRINRGEYEKGTNVSFDLNESTIALACSTGDVTIAVQLKREIGKLWENLDKAPYKRLFNPTVSGRYVNNCVRTQRIIDQAIRNVEQSLNPGRDQSLLIHGNRILSLLIFSKIMKKEYKSEIFNFDAPSLVSNMEKKVNHFFCLLKDIMDTHYENAIIPTFFKNRTKCEDLYSKILMNDLM